MKTDMHASAQPRDAAEAARAVFVAVQGKPFPTDIFTAPRLRWAVIGCGVIANQMAQSFALAGRSIAWSREPDVREGGSLRRGLRHSARLQQRPRPV